MAGVIVGRWGKNLAIRVPAEVAETTGLRDGERVEIEVRDSDILVRRQSARAEARKRAEEAVSRIIEGRKNYSLGDVTIRELIDGGRRY
ncbi:MAG: AbrB/MazE/SpoVT family DNA-binding domain-containing protein [Methylobacteriaceae bacterium]|nr:AbrB/MazE/SpoVT family DNA-binding domain-containing protein [Methylobacteriaceae bacterium]